MTRTLAALSVVFVLVLVLLPTNSRAAVSAEQRKAMTALSIKIKKAGNLFVQKKFQECGEVVKEAQAELEKLAEDADPQLLTQLGPNYNRLLKAHALLELEGVSLPALKKLAEMSKKTQPTEPPAGTMGVSFVQDVAPVLNRRCGGCHVRAAKGDFNMPTYAALMKATSEEGYKIVAPGKVNNSHLIAVIEDQVMPPNGSGIPATELETLKKWVLAGAKFDGPNPEQNLTRLTRGAANPTAMANQPTGKETVSFSADIAPILTQNCNGCHYKAQRVQGGLNMTSFATLLRGGDSGPVVTPGKIMESLLIDKIGPNAPGQRMPVRRPPLTEEQIAKITTWVAEGATFDGPDPAQDMGEVAALAKATMSTHEQLTRDRADLARRNWTTAMSGIKASIAETENFFVMGNVGEATLKEYGERAEAMAPKIAAIFKAPAGPLVKGRMTLYIFTQRYDYSEFGKMVERRDVPRQWRGHWKYSVVDAYGAMIPPRGDEYSLDGLVAQQLAGVYVAAVGTSPRWFSEGSARVAASRLAPDDPRVAAWDDLMPEVYSNMNAPADFMTGKMAPEMADVASYSFMKFLMKKSANYQRLLKTMKDGTKFEDAFQAAYGGTPAEASAAWARNKR